MNAAKGKISKHFYMNEVACRDIARTLPTGADLENAKKAAEMMERIRAFFGGMPISVNSWYRTPAWNRQCGGAKNSLHMRGMAVDFTVQGIKPSEVHRRLSDAVEDLGIGGLAGYKTFVHVDIGKRRTWTAK